MFDRRKTSCLRTPGNCSGHDRNDPEFLGQASMVQLWGKFLIITLVLALHNWAAGFPKSAASRIQ